MDRRVTCDLCGVVVDSRVSRYLFLALGWRGRSPSRPRSTMRVVFCGPCADFVVSAIAPYLRNYGAGAAMSSERGHAF